MIDGRRDHTGRCALHVDACNYVDRARSLAKEDRTQHRSYRLAKDELELVRCLRLPQEGPCECDLYLTCSKFVTTPAYAGRLRARVTVEEELICDAEERGRVREVERRQRIRARIIDLLTEPNEPIATNSATKRKR